MVDFRGHLQSLLPEILDILGWELSHFVSELFGTQRETELH